MTIETGALEQSYAVKEDSFNDSTPTSLSATDAIRHLTLEVSGKNNREPSPEKRGTPDEAQSLPGRPTAQWDLSEAMWEPSGTLGTKSSLAKFITGAFGDDNNIAAAAGVFDVEASPSPTSTGCTLTASTGLEVGDVIIVTVGSGARREATRVKTKATNAITFDALSAAPDVGTGKVVMGTSFKLANNVADSFAIYKYYNAGGFKQAVYGAVVERVQIVFDGTKPVRIAMQGPAADYADSSTGGGTVQSKPASHTTVGSPASGLVGNFYVDGNAFLVISSQITLTNQLELRNKELGTSTASGIAGRTAMRRVAVQVTFYLEDTRLIGMAHSVTRGVLRCVVGNANGGMVAAVVPAVEFEIPNIGGGNGPKEVTIEGIGYATSGNDQLFLGEA